MKRLILYLALALSLLPVTAGAQVEMSIQIGLPVAPPLVVVQPGIQVVENSDEEVFFVGGWYWCRRGDYWYRASGPQAPFVYVEPQRVPYRLAYLPPPGHYMHWRREQLGEERHWWKEHDSERRRAWKEHENSERHGWRAEGGPGRGGPAYAPSRGGPAYAPSRGGPAYAPSRGGPAYAPSRGGPAYAPSRGGPAYAPGRGGPAYAPAPSRGGPAPGHGDNGHGHDGRGH